MRTRWVALGVAIGSTLATLSAAQVPPPPPRREGQPPGREGREEAGRMVDAYVLSNLQESLGLNDEQFVKLLPLVKRLQADRREAMERRRRTLGEMRRLLKAGGATEAQVVDKLKEMKAIEAEERGRGALDAIDAQLTPVQQAKFRVFEAEVGQKLREMMAQFRRPNGPGVRSGRGAPRPPEP